MSSETAPGGQPVRYRVVNPDEFTKPAGHKHIGENEYLAPTETGIDILESSEIIKVLDWHYDEEAETGPVSFAGPPEPLLKTDEAGEEKLTVAYPNPQPGDGDRATSIDTVDVGTWICERCEDTVYVPVMDGQTEPPAECPGCERQGPFTHKDLSETEVKAAIRADEMWAVPSGISNEAYSEVWVDVRRFIHEHWDARESYLYDGLTAYVLTTWVRENLTFVPHLMLMGKTTGGKTRLLNTLARVSYRAIVTASATPSSMFRLIDAYDVTYYVSEYHGLGYEAQQELDNIVRAGQKRGELVTRSEPTSNGYEPTTFDPFAHVAIATQYTPDDDIVNRCVQVRSSPSKRDMPATLDDEQATELRNRLLYGRYRLLDSDEWAQAEREAYAYLDERDIAGRTREKLLGMVTVAILWDKLAELGPFVEEVVEQDREASADSEDARFVEAVRDLAFEEIGDNQFSGDVDPFANISILLSDVAERYETMTGIEKSASWAGHVRNRLDLDKKKNRDGTAIKDADLGEKLQQLCDENNLKFEPLDVHETIKRVKQPDWGTCSECGEPDTLSYHHTVEGYYMCGQCGEDLKAVLE